MLGVDGFDFLTGFSGIFRLDAVYWGFLGQDALNGVRLTKLSYRRHLVESNVVST